MHQTNQFSLDRAKAKAILERSRPKFRVEDLCFDKQLEFINHPSRFKTACCGGRAGKTVADAAYLFKSAQEKKGSVSLYITLSRTNAKKLIWPEILKINENYKLGAKVNESDLSVRLANGSFIYASGADKKGEIEKFRGLPLGLAIIDEVQSFKSYVQELVDDVITKRLFDYSGTLAMTGTPGAVPIGYFHDACISPNYSHFHWTMFDNPWIRIKSGKNPQDLLEEELARKGVTLDDPSIQREVFGKWVMDTTALVFKYDERLNHYDVEPGALNLTSYIIGVDLGFDDSDAISIIGWSESDPKAYLVYEQVASKQGITELAQRLAELVAIYKPIRVVMDTGGLGKKIAEEITKRFEIGITAAEKVRKFEYIELLNDAMRTGRFKAKKDSQFAKDTKLVEWDRDSQQPKIKDSFHSDICDSTLYSFREALHWLYEVPPEVIEPRSEKWFKKQEEKMEEAAHEAVFNREEDPLVIQDNWEW